MKTLPTLIVGAALALAAAPAATAQGSMPEFENATWLNTPPLSTQDMEGRAVLVEVFRTW